MASATTNLLSILVLAAGTAPSATAQSSELRGRVVSDSGAPVAGASVTLSGIRYTVRTDSMGRFHLSGTPGSTLQLLVQARGFREQSESVVLVRGRPVVRDFVLASEETPIPETNPSDRVLRIHAVTTEGEPIAYVNLQVNGGRRYVSDDSGRFRIPVVPGGRASVLLRRIGFEPAEVVLPEMPDTTMRVRMSAVARTLETQIVTVRSPFVRLDLSGFYQRMMDVEKGARVGYFVTPEDLALRNPVNVTDAVEQFPSIRLRPIDDGVVGPDGINHGDGLPLARKFRIEDRNGCPLTVYLDRVRLRLDDEVNTLIQPRSVAGIEVYPRGVGAPPEYPPHVQGTCNAGVVLIWTR